MTEPAPISSEIKATTFTPEQVVQFGKEGATASDALVKSLQEIREKDQSGEGAKKAIERLKEGDKGSSRLSQADLEKIANLEGIEETAKKAIQDEMRNVDIFLEVAERSMTEGVSEQVILNEIKKSGRYEDVPSLSEIQRTALKALQETRAIRSLAGSNNEDAINEIIVNNILSNPDNINALRQIYVQAKKEAVSRIDSLKPLKEVEGKKTKEEEKDILQEKTDRHIEALKTITELEEKQLRDLFEQDLDQEAIIEQLLQQTLEKKGVQGVDIPIIKKAIQSEVTIKSLDEEIKSIDDSIDEINERLSKAESTSAAAKKAKAERTDQIKAIKAEKERAEAKKASKQKTVDRLNGELLSLSDELKTKVLSYKDIYRKIYGKVAGITEEEIKATAAVPNHVKKLIEQLPQLKLKIKEIKSLEEADKEYQKQLAQRKFEEEDIIREIGTVLNDSMVDFLVKRVDIMTELDKKRLTKEQDEGLKKFDEWLEKRYIEFDTNKRREIHHRVTTGEDMRLVAWYGNDGVKRIAAKHLGYGTDPSTWTDEQKTNIDKIFDKKGQDIKKKLFTSYFKERTFFDKSFRLRKPFSKEFLFDGGIGDLTLTQAEWSRLGEHFGPEIEAGLASSKEAQKVLNGLKEKGINPNWNLKWLLWILIALGVIGGIAFFATKGG
ncbi:MAG: hypothetical protein V1803_01030 [Candidatus Roizmanbacteria bacterium]